MLAARCFFAQGSPSGRTLARVANLTRVVGVNRLGVKSFVANRASARLACSVRAALSRFAAQTAATDLVGKTGAGRFVRQDCPVEGVFVRFTDLAGVGFVGRVGREIVVADVTETLSAGIEEAALVFGAALSAAARPGAIRAAGFVAEDWRPGEPSSTRIADLTDVVLVDCVPGDGLTFDLAAAVLAFSAHATLALWAADAATADPVVSVGAAGFVIAQQRPIVAILVGVADLTGIGRVDRIRQYRLARDHAAARFAFTDVVATFVCRTANPSAAEAVIGQKTAAGSIWRPRRPVVAVPIGVADLARIELVDVTALELIVPDMTGALTARSVVAALTLRATLSGTADATHAARGIVVRGRPIAEVVVGLADLARIAGVDGTFVDILTADPAMRAALLAAGLTAALGRRTTFAVAADPPRHAAAGGLVVDEGPIEAVDIRLTNLASVRRVVCVRFDWLALDFALVRARILRTLDAVAALGGRAAFSVAADSPISTEGVIGRGRPVVAVTPRVAELTGVVRVYFAVVK